MRLIRATASRVPLITACVLSALAWVVAAGLASAQGYPSRPVTIVVPFTVGTGVDIIARSIGQKFSERWGQAVVVDNRTGASGIVGSNIVAHAQPDGHTLLLTSNALLMTTLLTKTTPYDPIKDFEPISYLGSAWLMVVANPDAKLENIADLIRAAKAQPNKLAYGSTGIGTPQHMAVELFKNITGTNLLHVPYKGTAPAVTDLISGQIQLMFLPVHVALPHVKAGRMRALAVASPERRATAPDTPTLKELGIPGADVVVWYGLLAPRNTPRDIVAKIAADVRTVAALPDVTSSAISQGIELMSSTPTEFLAFMETELARWPKIIREGGIKVD